MDRQIIIGWPQSHATKLFDNWNSIDEPQQQYGLGTVSNLELLGDYWGGGGGGLKPVLRVLNLALSFRGSEQLVCCSVRMVNTLYSFTLGSKSQCIFYLTT